MKAWMLATLAVGIVLLFGAKARAQVVSRTFDQLRFKVQAGDIVYVTAGGEEQKARVLEISDSSLVVSIDGARRELSETGVTRIRQRSSDSLWNGAVIGAATSIGAGIAIGASLDAIKDCDAACWAINGLYYGGIGALAGVGIDALVKGKKTIFAAAGGASSGQVAVRPILSAARKGLSVSVAF